MPPPDSELLMSTIRAVCSDMTESEPNDPVGDLLRVVVESSDVVALFEDHMLNRTADRGDEKIRRRWGHHVVLAARDHKGRARDLLKAGRQLVETLEERQGRPKRRSGVCELGLSGLGDVRPDTWCVLLASVEKSPHDVAE